MDPESNRKHTGNAPIFMRGLSKLYIDITLATEKAAGYIVNWRDSWRSHFDLGPGGQAPNGQCFNCGATDTPGHTISEYPRWNAERVRFQEDTGGLIGVLGKNKIQELITSEAKWDKIHSLFKGIVKKNEERQHR
ncbi:hypothetical protein JTB14_001258 [Gonioctena quinquepunctata]|nr:hypothetical protein JTB14_001258 [Gonioctena quinquepunctata]